LWSVKADVLVNRMDIPPQCSLELSPNGYQFLTELFQACDKDRDGALNERELAELFSTTPGNPWATVGFPESTITNEAGWVTLQGFLAQWSLMTLLDHRTTMAYLAYLGYNGDTREAFKITRPRKVDRRQGRVQRSVLLCYVLGPAGAGKVRFLSSVHRFEKKRLIMSYCI
jgi:Ras family protein T1